MSDQITSYMKRYSRYYKNTVEQKSKVSLSAGFNGSATHIISANSHIHFILDMKLHIKLGKLTDTSSGTGYISWVNNIGHKIIKSTEIKVGNTTLSSSALDYGRHLDILHELDCKCSLIDYDQLGKKKSVYGLKKYQDSEINLTIPLKFWFSEKRDHAFPHILSNEDFKFTLTTNTFESLHHFTSGDSGNVKSEANIDVNIELEISYYKISDEAEKATIKNSGHYEHIYKQPTQTYIPSLSTSNTIIFQDLLTSDIILGAVHNGRHSTNTSNTSKPLNFAKSSTNGNDKYNYSSNAKHSTLGTYDFFNTCNLNIDGTDHFETGQKSIDIRTGNKHLYHLHFTTPNEIHSSLNLTNVSNFKLTFSDIPSATFVLYAFVNQYQIITIRNGRIAKNAWSGRSNLNPNPLISPALTGTEASGRPSSAIKKSVSVSSFSELLDEPIDTSEAQLELKGMLHDNIFTLFNIIYKNNQIKLQFILGDGVTQETIDEINTNNYSLSILDNLRFLYGYHKIGLTKINYQKKLPKSLRLILIKKISNLLSNITDTSNLSHRHLFKDLLGHTKAFRVRLHDIHNHTSFENFLNEEFFIDKIKDYINDIYIVGRTYEVTIDTIFDLETNKYFMNHSDHYKTIIELLNNEFVKFEFIEDSPDISNVILVPAHITQDIPEDLIDIFTLKLTAEKTYTKEELIGLFFGTIIDPKHLTNILTLTRQHEGDEKHVIYKTFLQYIINYINHYKNHKNNTTEFLKTLSLMYGINFFKIKSSNRYRLYIPSKGETQIDDVNTLMETEDIVSISLISDTDVGLKADIIFVDPKI